MAGDHDTMGGAAGAGAAVAGAPAHPAVHVVPARVLVGIFAALIVLTAATVWVSQLDIGRIDLFAALGIATVKAALVALYFMHLRYDHPFNAIVFVTALVFVMLFVSFCLMDTEHYQPDIQQFTEQTSDQG